MLRAFRLSMNAPLNLKRAVLLGAGALTLAIVAGQAGWWQGFIAAIPLSGVLARYLDVRDYKRQWQL